MSHDRKSIEGKTAIAKDVLATVNKLSSEIEKYEYIRKLAVHLGVKEEIVIAEFEKTFSKGSRAYEKRRGFSDRPQDSPFHKHEPLSVTEKVLLKFMLTNPKAYALARKNLKEEYFNSYLARKTISFLFQDSSFKDVPIEKLLGTVRDKEVSGFISEILMDEDIPSDKDTFKESLLKLRKKGAVELKRKLQDKIRDAESRGDKEALRELLNKFTQIK